MRHVQRQRRAPEGFLASANCRLSPGATRGCATPAGSAPALTPPCSQKAGFLSGPYGLWPGRLCGHPFPWLFQSPRLGLEPSLASCPAHGAAVALPGRRLNRRP